MGVNAPQRSRTLVRARTRAFDRLMLQVTELWAVESNSIPITVTRNKNSATPGKPAGNTEKSRCTGQ